MLKVDNLTFEVNEEERKRCLVNHISFEVKDGEIGRASCRERV